MRVGGREVSPVSGKQGMGGSLLSASALFMFARGDFLLPEDAEFRVSVYSASHDVEQGDVRRGEHGPHRYRDTGIENHNECE